MTQTAAAPPPNYNSNEPPLSGKRIIIRNLPPGTTRDELHELGNKYGRVVSVEMVPKPDRPFGFVSFLTEDDAGFTIYRLNGYRYKNYQLEVAFSSSKLPPKPKTGTKGRDDKPKKVKKKPYSLRTLTPVNPPTPSPQQQQQQQQHIKISNNDSHKSWDTPLTFQTSDQQQQPDNGYIPPSDKSPNQNNAKRSNHNQNASNYMKQQQQQQQQQQQPSDNQDKLINVQENTIATAPIEELNTPPNDQESFPVTEIQINIPPNTVWCTLKLGTEQLHQFVKALDPFLQITEYR